MSAIVLAHSGTGKSYCAKMQPERFFEVLCMPYKYLLKERLEGQEAEAMKASYPVEAMNPEYPGNYNAALKEYCESGKYEYLVAPPDWRVAFFLEKVGIPYILVYPECSLKDEYKRRYVERGNSEEFLEIFIGGWERFMEQMDDMNPETRIRLGSGQYLSDVL